MPITTAGREHTAGMLLGESLPPFNNSNSHIGVGDSATAFSTAQTDLVGASTSRKPMEAGYPLRNGNIISFRSIFDTSDANFTWNEWGIFNALEEGTMFTRKVESLGTKNNTQTWQLTVNITIGQ